MGISARHSGRLFKFQLFSHAGTGIGLLTSLELVRAMGGNMWVRSVRGRGCTFYFTIRVYLLDGEPHARA